MKKLFIFTSFIILNIPAYAMTKNEIKSVCAEIITEQAKKDKSFDLRAQKMAENACICIGLEMPSSVSKQKFKQLATTNDESIESISKACVAKELFSMPEMQLLMLSDF